jgi:23S rRNA A1618 N6-methylase RlmF
VKNGRQKRHPLQPYVCSGGTASLFGAGIETKSALGDRWIWLFELVGVGTHPLYFHIGGEWLIFLT